MLIRVCVHIKTYKINAHYLNVKISTGPLFVKLNKKNSNQIRKNIFIKKMNKAIIKWTLKINQYFVGIFFLIHYFFSFSCS